MVAHSALDALAAMLPHLRFYASADAIQAVISQMLVLDIRSRHQKRGMPSETIYSVRLDELVVQYIVLESTTRVVEISRSSGPDDSRNMRRTTRRESMNGQILAEEEEEEEEEENRMEEETIDQG
jgi:hypothetical protein